MIKPFGLAGKNIGVFGLARTGLVAVDALKAAGVTVFAWDDNPDRCALVGDAAHNLYDLNFEKLDGLMIAPGVPLTHPEPHALVKKAHAANVPVFGDFDLFFRGLKHLPNRKTVVITGTNGKSTTTALVSHMLSFAGIPVAMGGNIGTGVLSLPILPEGGVYVLEMSSYQIDLSHEFSPDVAALLNISPDHLDRHGDMIGYISAKARLFDLLSDRGLAVVGCDDSYSMSLARGLKDQGRRVVKISSTAEAENITGNGIYVSDSLLFVKHSDTRTLIGSVKKCKTLRGVHNAQNMAAAFAIGYELGIRPETILDSFESFPGLEHRQELLGTIGGITFINDSKATNQEGTSKALASFKNIHWIAGGVAKSPELQEIAHWMPHVKKAYFIGEAAPMFMRELGEMVDAHHSITLKAAFDQAVSAAEEGDVIMLSPAAASFDQFKDFEDRGNQFKALVTAYGEAYS